MLLHIPDNVHVTTRYCGWYANRPRGMRRQAEPAALEAPPVIIPAPRLAPTEASRRWATLLQQMFEVNPLVCPTCHGPMRVVAFITQPSVIDQILTHLRTRASRSGARRAAEPPIDAGPREPGGVTRPTPVRRRSAGHLSSARTPRHHAGTFGVGGGPTGATDWPPPASLPPRCPPFPRPSSRTNESAGTPPPASRCLRGR